MTASSSSTGEETDLVAESAASSSLTPPPTEMLYLTYEGNWLTECDDAKVVSVKKEEEVIHICLDKTVMHSQGGGQPTDVGTITYCTAARASTTNGTSSSETEFSSSSSSSSHLGMINITKVLIDRDTGIATHYGNLVDAACGGKTAAASAAGTAGAAEKEEERKGDVSCQHVLPSVGDVMKVQIDVERRRLLSECHTAGHVVDSAMAKCGKNFKPTKGYHFLDGPYVEYEGKVPAEQREELLQDLQSAFQQLVEEDIPTNIELMSRHDADVVCNRVAKNFDVDVFADKRTDQVRVVTVAGFPCPCGGTHVKSTSELKKYRHWNVTGIKCKKNVVRIKYGYQNLET